MSRKVIYDANGYPRFAKASPTKLVNGLKLNIGNTRAMSNNVYDNFLQTLHDMVPWQYDFEKFPLTIYRDIKKIVIFFLKCYCDGIMCEKWNEYYHSKSFDKEEYLTCNVGTSQSIIEEFHLKLGEKYVIQEKRLMLNINGDGFKIEKSNAPSGLVCLVKPHVFEHKNLQQTLQISIPWMISGESHYNPALAELYDQESTKLGKNGSVSFKSNKCNLKICVRWYRYDNGDWPWVSSMVHRSMSHTSKHPFMYWIHQIGEDFVCVRNEENKLFKAIQEGINDEHLPWNLNEDNINEYSNFYTLATEKHWKVWSDNIEEHVSNISNYNSLSHKQKHSRRLRYAKKEWQPVLYRTGLPLVHYVLDVMHFIIRYAVIRLSVLTIFCHCIAQLSLKETNLVLKHACMLYFNCFYYFLCLLTDLMYCYVCCF